MVSASGMFLHLRVTSAYMPGASCICRWVRRSRPAWCGWSGRAQSVKRVTLPVKCSPVACTRIRRCRLSRTAAASDSGPGMRKRRTFTCASLTTGMRVAVRGAGLNQRAGVGVAPGDDAVEGRGDAGVIRTSPRPGWLALETFELLPRRARARTWRRPPGLRQPGLSPAHRPVPARQSVRDAPRGLLQANVRRHAERRARPSSRATSFCARMISSGCAGRLRPRLPPARPARALRARRELGRCAHGRRYRRRSCGCIPPLWRAARLPDKA